MSVMADFVAGEDLMQALHTQPQLMIQQDDMHTLLPPDFSQDTFRDIPCNIPYPDLSYLTKPPTILDELEHNNYEFEVQISSDNAGKSSYIYSSKLRKLFVKIGQTFTVIISYKNGVYFDPKELYLRIMPVFTDLNDQHEPVKRCRHHTHDNSGEINSHILTCKNQHVKYMGRPDGINFNERLCVEVPFTSNEPLVKELINIEFQCQNSCASGISRRNTALIFTLETKEKEIVGKRLLYFKVCSCPKRDCQKEEEAILQGKRKREEGDQAGPSGKRPCKIIVKQEPTEFSADHRSREVTVSLSMPDVTTMVRILTLAANDLAGQACDAEEEPRRTMLAEYRKKVLELQAQLAPK